MQFTLLRYVGEGWWSDRQDTLWHGLREIAKGRHETVSHLLAPSTRIGNMAIGHPPFPSLSLAFIAIASTEHKRSWLRRSRQAFATEVIE